MYNLSENIQKGNYLKNDELDIFNLGYVEICGRDIYQIASYESGVTVDDKYKSFEPILIDSNWHNKFGIEVDRFHQFTYRVDDYRLIIFSGDYIYIRHSKNINEVSPDDDLVTLWNNDIKRRCIYVHEFQNLYKIISGNSLKVK